MKYVYVLYLFSLIVPVASIWLIHWMNAVADADLFCFEALLANHPIPQSKINFDRFAGLRKTHISTTSESFFLFLSDDGIKTSAQFVAKREIALLFYQLRSRWE